MLLDNLKNRNIILASKSPRRQELLKGLDIEFEIRNADVNEIYPKNLHGVEIARFLSELKSEAMRSDLNDTDLLITSDTIVILGDEILEKPQSREDAVLMLQKISGKTHIVATAFTLATKTELKTFHETTEVFFNELTQKEIEYYLDNYQPYDKAGSYGVQELIGYIGINKLVGCYYNVMGLPLQKLYKELKKVK